MGGQVCVTGLLLGGRSKLLLHNHMEWLLYACVFAHAPVSHSLRPFQSLPTGTSPLDFVCPSSCGCVCAVLWHWPWASWPFHTCAAAASDCLPSGLRSCFSSQKPSLTSVSESGPLLSCSWVNPWTQPCYRFGYSHPASALVLFPALTTSFCILVCLLPISPR